MSDTFMNSDEKIQLLRLSIEGWTKRVELVIQQQGEKIAALETKLATIQSKLDRCQDQDR